MNYKVNFADLVYEAHFRRPLFALAHSSVRVLEVLHERLSAKYPITPGDMSLETGRNMAELRARVNLFRGAGTLDITAESLTARFQNPRGKDDYQIIQDCVTLAHEALVKLGEDRPIREQSINIRIFGELVDGADASTFLRGLFPKSTLLEQGTFPSNADMVPGFVLDLFQDEERWAFNFSVSQAIRSRKEMFLNVSVRYFEGNKLPTIKEKADHFGQLISSALSKVGLQPDDSGRAAGT